MTAGLAIGAGVTTNAIPKIGTRPLIAAGALLGAGGVFWLSRVPVHGTYLSDLLPGMVIMGAGMGCVLVGVQNAANGGVPADKAGLAASLITASFQLGGALGLAIFVSLTTSRTHDLLATHTQPSEALTLGFHRGLLGASIALLIAAADRIASDQRARGRHRPRRGRRRNGPSHGRQPSAAGPRGRLINTGTPDSSARKALRGTTRLSEMTDSATFDRPGKRDRLVAGARDTIYRQGVEATTIADIAQAAEVPVGNVYYYFKTKDDLVTAAIDSYAQENRELLSRLEQQHRSPRARLKALVQLLVSQSDQVALYGCPRGSLCSELDKHDSDLAQACSALMRTPTDWMEQQFKAMGRRDARDLAFALLASYEGIALLANTFRDPELMIREGRRLKRWIDSLARDANVAAVD